MKQAKKRILILGAGGFIGSHIVEHILQKTSWEVTGVDVSSKKVSELIHHQRFNFIEEEIYQSALSQWIQDCDVVISLAAICNPSYYNTEPLKVIESNYTQPLNIVKNCAQFQKWLIHFSTSEIYGRSDDSASDSSNLHASLSVENSPFVLGPVSKQRWTYSCAKQLLERTIYAYAVKKKLKYSIIRPFNFIGPRMDYIPGIDGEGIPRVIACFMKALLFQEPLQIVDGGSNKRVFTYIDEGVEPVLKMIERPEQSQGKIFNIGNPENETSIVDLANKMIKLYSIIAGVSLEKVNSLKMVSSEEFYGIGYEDSVRRNPDIKPAQQLLHWQPKIDLHTALSKTIKAMVEQYIGEGNLIEK